MGKFLAIALFLTVFASPAFAAGQHHKAPRQHIDYRYHAPKRYKPQHHTHHQRAHSHHAS
jgi:hypothetical protein